MSQFGYLHRVLSQLYARFTLPQFQQYTSIYKMPINPKIVVFGSSPAAQSLVSNHFATYYKVDGKAISSESDEKQSRIVAESVLRVDEDFGEGHIIQDFPKNTNQALRLDTIVDGVNLAILFKSNDDSQTAQTYKDVLNYYKERGTLLEFQIENTQPLQQQTERLQDAILANIKL